MTLRNFDTDLDTAQVTRLVRTPVTITETVQVVHRPSQARAFVAKDDENWSWSDLRDYVVAQIEQRFGAFPRDLKKEAGIFKSFLARHGDAAPAIARFAFDVENGYWAGAPVSVNRFCRGSDPFFAAKILDRLVVGEVQGW